MKKELTMSKWKTNKKIEIKNLNTLLCQHDVKLIPLAKKTRLTKKTMGYGYFDVDGNFMVPRAWRKQFRDKITDIGILCQFIPDLGYYLCVLDIDTKDFPLKELIKEYPSSVVETKKGFHVYYLSTDPCRIKQLSGKEKELCPVDLRAQRDPTNQKEGNYVRYYEDNVMETPLNIVDYNEVVKYVYGLFGIQAIESDYNKKDIIHIDEVGKKPKSRLNNAELFVAFYLANQKDDWESAYDVAFPFGVQLSGWFDEKAIQRIAWALMSETEYYRPRKWITAFLTGYLNGQKGHPCFGKKNLDNIFRGVIKREFKQMDEKDISMLAEYLKNVKLYQILNLIMEE